LERTLVARAGLHKNLRASLQESDTPLGPLDGTELSILRDAVFAYLDPGTGSMLVQLLVGGVAAAGVAIKLYWHRILRLLRIRKAEPEPDREP
jgi:hypothetical protein